MSNFCSDDECLPRRSRSLRPSLSSQKPCRKHAVIRSPARRDTSSRRRRRPPRTLGALSQNHPQVSPSLPECPYASRLNKKYRPDFPLLEISTCMLWPGIDACRAACDNRPITTYLDSLELLLA